MTEFGEKEQSRLAELLGDEYGMRICRRCRGGEFKFDECWMCHGTGMSRPPIPTGLALIEECRKRGVFINHYANKEGYSVFCWLLNGEIPYDSDEEGGTVSPEDLESAVSLAALKGLEALYGSAPEG